VWPVCLQPLQIGAFEEVDFEDLDCWTAKAMDSMIWLLQFHFDVSASCRDCSVSSKRRMSSDVYEPDLELVRLVDMVVRRCGKSSSVFISAIQQRRSWLRVPMVKALLMSSQIWQPVSGRELSFVHLAASAFCNKLT
jgi:hypothetical protein